jgi:glycosyltransferase involved in cell wall biosynthesis
MRVTFFIPSYGDGGVERDFVNTARGLSGLGVTVDFVTAQGGEPYMEALPESVPLVRLGGTARIGPSFDSFVKYLRKSPPDVLLCGKDTAFASALAARSRAGVSVPIVMRPGTVVSAKFRASRFWRRVDIYRRMRRYRRADLLIGVSEGVADDVTRLAGVDRRAIEVIHSPIVTPRLYERAVERVLHPWLMAKDCPVILAAGGLRRQKDFSTLLRAFALARKNRKLRLIIVGRGRLLNPLKRLTRRLDVADHVDFAGFVENPYPLFAAADVFALSSLWEGLGNVLVEALALGRRVVATDCPSGPREVLADGRYGTLVPVRAPGRMAQALLDALDSPSPEPRAMREAIDKYTIEFSTMRYKDVMERLALGSKGME